MQNVVTTPSYRGALLAVVLAAAAWLTWLLRLELIVLFAAAVFGVALFTLARWLVRRTGWPHKVCVVIWYFAGILLFAGFVMFANHQLSSEYGELGARLPSALETLETRLREYPLMSTAANQIRDMRTGLTENGEQEAGESEEEQRESEQSQMELLGVTIRTLSNLAIFAVLSFYIAYDGRRYYRAALSVVPPARRDEADELGRALTHALPWWLVGRLSSMLVVTLLTAPGLLLLGIPLALLLGVIAGLFSFVPFLGPIASVMPAALIALDSAPEKVIWVLVLFGGVQFLESNVITPKMQERFASIPALVLIGAQFLMGVLVGVVGVMFSTPLALTAMVAIKVLWIRHHLGEEAELPGPGEPEAA